MGLSVALTDFAESTRGGFDAYIYGQNSRVDRHDESTSISAPTGIVDFQPDEMTIRCGAGTTLEELEHVVGSRGQYVNLPTSRRSSHRNLGTVGGALAVGESGPLRLGRGPIRDALLQVTFVDHAGRLVTAGGPTVKNVSGFDLCRLHVGTFGVFGFMGEVILRTRPVPAASRWYSTEVTSIEQVSRLSGSIYKPGAILWDGCTVWLCLEGHPLDIDDTVSACETMGHRLRPSDAPDPGERAHRWSTTPGDALRLATSRSGRVLVEVGVGIVHDDTAPPDPFVPPANRVIVRRLLDEFNPERRLNRGFVERVV